MFLSKKKVKCSFVLLTNVIIFTLIIKFLILLSRVIRIKKQNVYKVVLILRNILICVFSFVLLSLLILSIKRLFLNIDVIDFGKYSLVLDEIYNSHLFINKNGLFIEGDRVILNALGALVECEVVTIEGELFAYFKDGNIDYYFNLVDSNVIGIVDSIVNDRVIFLESFIILVNYFTTF